MDTVIQILTWIYYCALSFAAFYCIFKFKAADKATRFICILIWNGFITEIIAWQFARAFHNNLSVYTISCFVELSLVSLYYNYSIDVFRRWRIGVYIGILGLLSGVLNTVILQPLDSFNSNFLFLEGLLILLMSLFALFRILIVDDYNLQLQGNLHFWIPCVFVLYQCGTLLSWNAYQYFVAKTTYEAALLHICILFINIVAYLAFVFLLYHFLKMRKDTDHG